eukprot:TRINITY_DN13499_c0_g1_i3.p1 TRINITY_DN13499_c0_g1~~TRINITY_DN13499_c0_g1_i3.p1  ORF type:complete len:209 (-),score=16.21 TRINITY_DN13499_c0_g1_i3:161-787(-)
MVHDSFIGQLDQYCLPLVYYSFKQLLQVPNMSNIGIGFSSIAAVFTLIAEIIFIIFAYKLNNISLSQNELSVLKQNLRKSSNLTKNFRVNIIARKFVYGCIFGLIPDHPIIQLSIISLLAVLFLALIVFYRPFTETSLNFLGICDELCLGLVAVLLLIQDQIEWFPTKENIGWVICSLVWLTILCHLFNLYHVLVFHLQMAQGGEVSG